MNNDDKFLGIEAKRENFGKMWAAGMFAAITIWGAIGLVGYLLIESIRWVIS